MNFHGQFNDDSIAYRYFRRFRDAELRKTFLEIGAFDGVEFSNSLLFEELGWTGICVEANSEIWPRLRANRRCICLNVACSDTEGMAEYFGGKDATPLGTISLQAAEMLNAAVPKWNVAAKQTIQTQTVDQILAQNGMPEIDFVSIDVDGSELQVLRGFDLRRARPKLICIETNFPMIKQGKWPRAHADEIDRIITGAGFHLLMINGTNSFYSHEKLTALERLALRLQSSASRLANDARRKLGRIFSRTAAA